MCSESICFKKEKRFKEKEKCGETVTSVMSGCCRFLVSVFLWVKNDGKESVDGSDAADGGVMWVEGNRRSGVGSI